MTVRLRVMQLLCRNSDTWSGWALFAMYQQNIVSLNVCCDAITVTYDQGGSHLLCKNNEIVRLKVYRRARLRVYKV